MRVVQLHTLREPFRSEAEMTEESEVISKYSSPGLKRNMLSRYAKAWHLRENYRMTREEREALLDQLYDEKPK